MIATDTRTPALSPSLAKAPGLPRLQWSSRVSCPQHSCSLAKARRSAQPTEGVQKVTRLWTAQPWWPQKLAFLGLMGL